MTDRSIKNMPRSSEQNNDIRKDRIQLIMAVALELFAENGYHATSISRIAQKAGISKGLTYNYFQSKKDILDALISYGFEQISIHFDQNKDGILTDEEFVYFIRQNFKLLRSNMQHWQLFFSLMLQPKVTERFSTDYEDKIQPYFSTLLAFIKSKGSKDPEGDLMAISSMLEGAFLYCVAAPEVFAIDIMEEKIINACFKILNHKNEN